MIDAGIAVGVRTMRSPDRRGRCRCGTTPRSTRHRLGSSRKRSSAPLLVFYHGGGFVVGDLDTHDALCRLLCRDAGVHVMAVDYRLAPEHPAPAAVDDCYAAYRWALEHAAELGADPSRVAVGGDSAGGNLSAVVSQLARNDGMPLPALQVLLYPVTDFAATPGPRRSSRTGYFLTTKRHGLVQGQLPGRVRARRGRPACLPAAGRRPVRPAAGDGADGRVRPAARRRQPVRRGVRRGRCHRRPPAIRPRWCTPSPTSSRWEAAASPRSRTSSRRCARICAGPEKR